jgi:chitodextrinase
MGAPRKAAAATDSCTPPGTTYGTDTLSVSIPSSATYTIWTRLEIPDSSDNAVLLNVDSNASCYNVGGNSSLPVGSWQWVDYNDGSTSNVINITLSAGTHTFEFIGTDPSVEIDRMLAVSTSGSCTPTGTGDNCTQVSPPPTPSTVNATANSSTSVTVTWSTSNDSGGPGLGGYYILRGGVQVGSVNASTTSYTDTSVSAGTQYSYTVEAYDTLGNVSAASGAASVTTPNSGAQSPTIGLTSLPNNTALHGSAYTITATATPVSGNTITQAQLLVNNTVVQTLTSSPYTFSLSTLSYEDGSYTVTVKATDNKGNVGTTTATVLVTNGDFTGAGSVGIADLSIMASHWGATDPNYADGNITGQSTINVSDLSILAKNWGQKW